MGRDSKGKGGGGRGNGRGSGRRMFIENVDELAKRDAQIAEDRDAQRRRRADGEEEGGSGSVSEEEGDEEKPKTEVDPTTVFRSMQQRKPLKLIDDDEEEELGFQGDLGVVNNKVANPNMTKGKDKMIKIKDLANAAEVIEDPETAGMNRKEREAVEAARKKEEYQKRHMAGQTEEARKELEKLKIVRARREADRLKREAEGRAPGWSATGIESSSDDDSSDEDVPKKSKNAPPVLSEAAARKKAAAAAPVEEVKDLKKSNGKDDELPILKGIDIKKMNGDALKDALKARGLDFQGQKKDLMKRLQDFDSARA